MNKAKLKQGTLAWEKTRETRIGSSEVFDIVRYYATDEELQNCGIPPGKMREEKPLKYVMQAQCQLMATKADFFMFQIMTLKHDTVYERGLICGMSPAKRNKYLSENMEILYLYFRENPHISALIETCVGRFFDDVNKKREPTPFIESDSQKNILESIRANSFFNADATLDYELCDYIEAKKAADEAEAKRKGILQTIIEVAKKENACKFISKDGTRASFSANGAFLVKRAKE